MREALNHAPRRGGRAVECGGLENRLTPAPVRARQYRCTQDEQGEWVIAWECPCGWGSAGAGSAPDKART